MSPDTRIDQLADDLRRRIQEREFGTAGRLPSLRMLAEEYETTRETMNKVVQRLQAEGLLLSQGRAGVFIHGPQEPIPGITSRFDKFLEGRGLTSVETNIVPPSIIPASKDVAAAFDVLEGTPVVRRYRRQGVIQGTIDKPYRLTENFYAPELVGKEELAQIQNDVHFDLLVAKGR